ncbi:MAG: peptide chain release factor 2 [Anaerolineae bacterium]|nr:peptide chain release factor 2 [Anaerolineae bacterium]MCB0223703.1 peptide chain release factor 2 [Anaerolineae bacterium]MCB9106063.1 peptide chain release factor 2 [Anaerolineales bacterium]
MDELNGRLTDLVNQIGSNMVRLDVAGKEQQAKALEQESQAPDFWNDQRQAQEKMQQLSMLRDQVTTWQNLSRRAQDALTLVEMATEEEDTSLLEELTTETEAIEKQLGKLEFQLAFSGKHDKDDGLLSIHAGAGGTESQDWAEMLMRMYLRWAEANGYKALIVDETKGEEAGIKSVTLEISGDYAYGYLKAERGVHRLVRISPFDASKRRHTSFALVEVVPDVKTDIEIEIKPEDIEIDVYKSGGAGGQHVQKNSTAIRIRHLPTGMVVTCQNERSQLQNREMAMRILRGRLYDLELKKQEEEEARLKGQHVEAGWGNQIRSYVLHPYKMVKDHRTNHEVGNAEAVLDGRLDDFIEAYLRYSIGDQSAVET